MIDTINKATDQTFCCLTTGMLEDLMTLTGGDSVWAGRPRDQSEFLTLMNIGPRIATAGWHYFSLILEIEDVYRIFVSEHSKPKEYQDDGFV